MSPGKKFSILVMATIVLLAAGLRLYQLGTTPDGLYIDEIAILVDARSVSETGLDMHGRPWYQVMYLSYGDFKLPVYLWLASISVSFFGVSDLAVRLPSALAGIGTVVVAGLIARSLLKNDRSLRAERWQWISMLVVAVSPWGVLFSRTGFEGNVGQFLLALSVWLGLKGREKNGWLYLSAIIGGVATYAYFSVRFVWPVVFCLLALLFVINWRQAPGSLQLVKIGKELFVKICLPLLLFGLLLLPMVNSPLFEASNRFRLSTTSVLSTGPQVLQSNIYRELAGNQPIDRVLFHRTWLTVRELASNYADNVSLNFLFMTGDPNLRHGMGSHGLFLIACLPLLFIGLYGLFDRQKMVLILLGCWWLIALLPASVPDTTPHALRSLNALVPVALLIGFGGVRLWELIERASLRRSIKRGVLSLVILICTLNVGTFLWQYFAYYAADSAAAWQQGYRELALQIDEYDSVQHRYILSFDERFYLWMMAYGSTSAVEFQQWPSQHSMFKDMPAVTFDQVPTKAQLLSTPGQVLIAGKLADVDSVAQTLELEVLERRSVFTYPDQTAMGLIIINTTP